MGSPQIPMDTIKATGVAEGPRNLGMFRVFPSRMRVWCLNSRNQNRETYRQKTNEAAHIFQRTQFLETFVRART